MSQRVRIKSSRNRTLLWVIGLGLVIIALLVWHQTALLYVLSTLGVTALLVVVALADLGGTSSGVDAPPVPGDDAAAIGSGILAGGSTPRRGASAGRSGRGR